MDKKIPKAQQFNQVKPRFFLSRKKEFRRATNDKLMMQFKEEKILSTKETTRGRNARAD